MGLAGAEGRAFRYRADIDGLRAIAVLSVMGFHATPNFVPGGFVGVDVFFVISGFLISSLILTDLKAGRFSYLNFYERRVRRLFPALIVVLLATWGLALFVFLPVELIALGKHMVAAAGFAGNVLNYLEAGYFDAPAITKPLLHLWSLGVEEQFYLVFPALLIGLWRFPRARLLLGLIGIVSFVLNIGLIRDHASFTFYMPMTRFWEFVAGAMLAPGFIAYRATSESRREASWGPAAREIAAAAGLTLLIVAIAITGQQKFPGWMALLPVIGTVLIIQAGPDTWLNRVALGNPKLVLIGLISYPLYLWHWPLIVLGRAMMRTLPNHYERTTALVAVALAFVLAYLTYRFIERPIRERRATFVLRGAAFKLAGGLAAVALLAVATVQSRGLLFVYPPAVQALLAPLPFTLDPVDGAAGGTGPVLVTYGDSHAGHLHAGLRRLQNEQPFRLIATNWGRCSPLGDREADDKDKCDSLHAANKQIFERQKPDVVVIAGFWSYYNDIGQLAETLRFFRELGVPRIVVIGSVPFWPRAPQSLLFEAYQADPQHRIPDRLFGFDERTIVLDQQLKTMASAAGAIFVSAQDVLCDARGCLARLGESADDIVQVDRTHLSANGSWYLISRIADRIFDRESAPRVAGSAERADAVR